MASHIDNGVSAVRIEGPEGPVYPLARKTVLSNSAWTEGWLQNLIHKHPWLLPGDQFGDEYAPLFPLARGGDRRRPPR